MTTQIEGGDPFDPSPKKRGHCRGCVGVKTWSGARIHARRERGLESGAGVQDLWGPGESTTGVDKPSTLRAGMWIWLLPLVGNWKESFAGERGAMGLRVLQKWMVDGSGLGVSSTGVRAWEGMTVGVKVLVADPGASKLFTAAFTLSRDSPGGSVGSSSPLGFFGLEGTLSDAVDTETEIQEEEEGVETAGSCAPVILDVVSSGSAPPVC